MTIRHLLRRAEEILALAGVPDPKVDAEALLSHLLDSPRLLLRACGEQEVSPARERAFMELTERRAGREPLQYILGAQSFMGRDFIVTRDVLIPRMDTETLCEQALLSLSGSEKALDLCTGSGALAVTLKADMPGLSVFASDISKAALDIAKRNAQAYEAKIDFRQGDLFAPFKDEAFDLIVCNPPYIKDGDMSSLQEEVKREPEGALRGGKDGLDFYRRLACDAPLHLHENGLLLMEIGDRQAEDVIRIFNRFSDTRVIRDLSGLDRVVSARWREQG